MMQTNIEKLLQIASPALCDQPPQLPDGFFNRWTRLGKQLINLLEQRNGFFAFESALHLFPACPPASLCVGYDLVQWNSESLWRFEYRELAEGYLFFAEDIFGCQFAIRDETIYRFDPETGDAETMASSLDEWAERIFDDYAFETGYPFAHEWQQRHGALAPN